MKEKLEFESMGLKGFIKNLPETPAEYDQLAGRANACLNDALDYSLFHIGLTDFRKNMMSALVKETNIKPKTKDKVNAKKVVVKDAKGNPVQVVDEKPQDFFDRVVAQLKKTVTDFQELAFRVCGGIKDEKDETKWFVEPLDFAELLKITPRQPRTPPKMYLELADSILARDEEGRKRSYAKIAETISAGEGTPREALSVDVEREELAWELQRYEKARSKNELVTA